MSSALINKIHVTNSTGLSLNERFTAIATQPVATNQSRSRSRSRSRSTARGMTPVASNANRRLLQKLAKQHKIEAARKLTRRSIKNRVKTASRNGNGVVVPRGTIKAFRIGASGRPVKINTFARTATMNADLVTNTRRPLRRSNSVRSLNRKALPGGAPERVARRRLERLAGDGGRKPQAMQRGRQRSRSRSRSRLPRENINATANRGRSRSRSRSRAQQAAGVQKHVPIKARLGLRPGVKQENPALRNRLARNSNVSRRGVQQGRVTKNNNNVNGTGGAQLRGRSRSRVRRGVNANERSRSRTRRGSVGQQQQQNGQQLQRSRSQSKGRRNGRGGGNAGQLRKNGRKNAQQKTGKNTNAKQQGGVPRRGRSRSRGVRNGARNLGNGRLTVNKEDLDKELDQYMSTTKTGDMDYLLK